jgi:hypothetical protein
VVSKQDNPLHYYPLGRLEQSIPKHHSFLEAPLRYMGVLLFWWRQPVATDFGHIVTQHPASRFLAYCPSSHNRWPWHTESRRCGSPRFDICHGSTGFDASCSVPTPHLAIATYVSCWNSNSWFREVGWGALLESVQTEYVLLKTIEYQQARH